VIEGCRQVQRERNRLTAEMVSRMRERPGRGKAAVERIPYRKPKPKPTNTAASARGGAETAAAKPSAAIIYDAIIYEALKPAARPVIVVIIRYLRVFVSRP
jgi:hypothetical protein